MKIIAKFNGIDQETQVIEYSESTEVNLSPPEGSGWYIVHTDSKSSGKLRVTWTRNVKPPITILYD